MSEVQESPAAADDSVHHSGQSYVDPPPTPLLDANELKLWSLYRALMAEFIATLLFLYITVATIIGHTLQNAADPCDGVGVLGIAWAFGGTFFVLVYCTAGISGGHINPAVTFAMLLARKVSLIRALAYIIAQCAGATCGAALVRGLTGTDGLALVRAFMGTDGADFVIHGYKISTGLGAQIIGSFVLVYFVFSATDPKRNARDSHVSVLAPLPIGFAVFMVYLGTSSITGTGINPAWSFAVAAVFHSHNIWDDHWIYWAGPFLGALIAAAYHQYVLRAFSIASSFRTTSDDDDESIH